MEWNEREMLRDDDRQCHTCNGLGKRGKKGNDGTKNKGKIKWSIYEELRSNKKNMAKCVNK